MREPMRPAAPPTTIFTAGAPSPGSGAAAVGRMSVIGELYLPPGRLRGALAPRRSGENWSSWREERRGYFTSPYGFSTLRSVSRLASLMRHIGSRDPGPSIPAIAIASLMGMGLG